MCGFHLAFQEKPAQMKFEMASGCEWEWVATYCKKAKHLHRMRWETCRHNFWVIGAVVFGKLLQMTTKHSMSARGEPRTSKNKKQDVLKYHNTTKRSNEITIIMNWDEPQTITILRSSDYRGRHPQCAPPPIGHAIRRVWMDPLCTNVWTQCWGARFISSNETPQQGTILSPWGWGQESGCACRICAREWTDELSVLGCVRDWECARLGENACKRRGKKYKYDIWRETKLRNATLRLAKVSGKKFCLRKRGWSSNPWKEELWIWKNHRHHKEFLFVLNYC